MNEHRHYCGKHMRIWDDRHDSECPWCTIESQAAEIKELKQYDMSPGVIAAMAHNLQCNLLYIEELEEKVGKLRSRNDAMSKFANIITTATKEKKQ